MIKKKNDKTQSKLRSQKSQKWDTIEDFRKTRHFKSLCFLNIDIAVTDKQGILNNIWKV
jgi:hypothetical protein